MNLTEKAADGLSGVAAIASDEGGDDVDDSTQALRNLDVKVGGRQSWHDGHNQEAQVGY